MSVLISGTELPRCGVPVSRAKPYESPYCANPARFSCAKCKQRRCAAHSSGFGSDRKCRPGFGCTPLVPRRRGA